MILQGDIVRVLASARSLLEVTPTPERVAKAAELLDALEFRIVSDALSENIDLNLTVLEAAP